MLFNSDIRDDQHSRHYRDSQNRWPRLLYFYGVDNCGCGYSARASVDTGVYWKDGCPSDKLFPVPQTALAANRAREAWLTSQST